jgi:hypothetical protein
VGKTSVPQFRISALCGAGIALFAVGVCTLKFPGFHARDWNSIVSRKEQDQSQTLSAGQRDRIRASFATLPLAFERNQGQADPHVKYTARANGYSVFLTANEAVLAISSSPHSTAQPSRTHRAHTAQRTSEKVESATIDMRLVAGNANPEITAGDPLPGIVNYYAGSDPKNWHTGVRQYSSVSYRDVYPGVSMVFHGEQRQLEFDFRVSPGADPKAIALSFHGVRQLETDASGNLVLSSSAGNVVLHKPVAYQEKDGTQEIVEAAFQVKNRNEVGLDLGAYDQGRDLVIDPVLSYATYLGGGDEDEAYAVALDSTGKAYVTGQTKSTTFGNKPAGPNFDAFVTKLNPGGSLMLYTDIFSATGGDCSGTAIAVNPTSGEAFVAGNTATGFPITPGAFQTFFGGGTGTLPLDGFVIKVDSTGAPEYSTYLGGSGNDDALGLAIDNSGSAYVVGETESTDFPTVTPILNSNAGGITGFIAKLRTDGSGLVYSTYLGGSSTSLAAGVALDGSNNAYVTGITDASDFPITNGVAQKTFGGASDAFVTEVKADGSGWAYSTFVGGSGTDEGFAIAVDGAGEAYITGNTNSPDFPTVNAAQTQLGGSSATNVFVSKLGAGGTEFLFSTYYGGAQDDSGTGIALDSFADAYVTGRTTSSAYPVTSDTAFQTALSGTSDAFVTEFASTGFVVYSSFLGGTGTENAAQLGQDSQGPVGAIAVDGSGFVYLVGTSASTTGFPATGVLQPSYNGGSSDGFAAKIRPASSDFAVAVSPTSVSTPSGQTSPAVTVTVSSVNSSFGQVVGLSCGNLPVNALCQFDTPTLTPGSSSVTSNLTIATNATSSAYFQMPGTDRHRQTLAAVFLPVFGLAFISIALTSHRKRLFAGLLLGLVLTALVALPACSGSGHSGGGGGSVTPAGTYNITVSGSASGTSHGVALTLTVN